MIKSIVVSGALCLALASGAFGAPGGQGADRETALRQSMQQAFWPADIVRLSGDYLRQYPHGPWSDAARALYERAQGSAEVLGRREVRLYRSAFQRDDVPLPWQEDLRRAALGDTDAATRLAHLYRVHGGAHGQARYVGWLQFAAMLGDDRAAYELALHFRQQDQPVLASQYEARAVSLGYRPPQALDHVRK